MKIVRSAVCGFCMGVRRAVELTIAEADRGNGERVFTLGPLIHNPAVLADLESRGVITLGSTVDPLPQTPESCSLVIRAHGIDPETERKLRDAGYRVIDATCTKVKINQQKAEELAKKGYFLFLAGEAEHAEIDGIFGYINSTKKITENLHGHAESKNKDAEDQLRVGSWLISNVSEAEAAAEKLHSVYKNAKTALLGQTTISEEEFLNIGEAIKKYFPNLEIFNTICSATKDRQQALRELLKQVDAVIIAGGKESANTQRLLAIAKESGKPCALAESAAEVPIIFHSYETVGLCAGASTPDSVIDEIELELHR